ncbi:hypothetical protein [Mycobacterium phage WXIN]|nr:hypothetical protein [Mycobacterium phage WXIN]
MKYEEALEIWTSRKSGIERAKLIRISVNADTEWSGGCESCGYDEVVHHVVASYIDRDGQGRYWELEVDFTQLLTELFEVSE